MAVIKTISGNDDGKTQEQEGAEKTSGREKIRFFMHNKQTGKLVREAPIRMVNQSKLRVGNVHQKGARQSQQDAFGISDISNERLIKANGVFAVVADGMGGLSNGAEISAFITSYMLNAFSKSSMGTDASKALLKMTVNVNREVVRRLSQSGNEQSGSTVVAAIINDRTLSFTSVGDSRIYLMRGGALFQVNREHNYGSELDEKAARGEITCQEAKEDTQREALTSYIGMECMEKIDRNIKPILLIEGDRVVLMTDGVYRTLTEEEMEDALKLSAEKAAMKLEALIMKKKKANQDNYTAVIFECV